MSELEILYYTHGLNILIQYRHTDNENNIPFFKK